MELQDTQAFVRGCFHDEPASCACVCPFGLDIRSFLKKMSRGRWPAAYRDLSAAILFPSLAAELCPQPCRGRCQRAGVGDAPLNMAELERACVAFAANEQAGGFPLQPKDKTVAVVGAGPAGLSCSLSLARKKYAVTVFDREPGWGGHLRSHPRFAVFEADFAKQFGTQNADFRFGTQATEELLRDFDAVYIATGEGGDDFGLRDGWDSALFTTRRPGWFMGGGVVSMPLMESVAAGGRLSQLMEAYLQTGHARLIVESRAQSCPGHMLEHPGEEPKPIILPADPEAGYTKDEARAEASRCMQCRCDICMTGCELMARYRKTPYKLAADVCGDAHTVPPFSNCEATRQTYSCNMCSLCGDACPEGVDMGKLFRYSREDRWKQNKWAPGLHDYWLRELDRNGGEGFYVSKNKCEYLFFPGCQLTASLPEQTLGAWRFLSGRLDAGIMLGCCGAPAIWAGDSARREENLARIRSGWEGLGRPKLVCACATCADKLREQIAQAEVTSLYELLEELGAPVEGIGFSEAAVFDPCSARRDDSLRRSVRALAERAGCAPRELKSPGKCCGYGGHIRLANPELYREITDNRAADTDLPYIVYCANCLEVFRSKGKDCVHILEAVFGPTNGAAPTLDEKRAGALSVKGRLMMELENVEFVPSSQPWDSLSIALSPDAQAGMEDKLITLSEVRETISRAEEDGDYFIDGTGLRTACLAKSVLTYWVDYRAADGRYEVESAYCHRMRIGEEEQP